jgi:hypothetical protein
MKALKITKNIKAVITNIDALEKNLRLEKEKLDQLITAEYKEYIGLRVKFKNAGWNVGIITKFIPAGNQLFVNIRHLNKNMNVTRLLTNIEIYKEINHE